MRKLVISLIGIIVIFSLTACGGMSISGEKYEEIAEYVVNNIDTFEPEKEIVFYDYESTGIGIGGIYYGYYYTADDEIVVPDFYTDEDLGDPYQKDGGTYFGKPMDGANWCFVKKIADHWYYYELHWS